MNSAPLFNKIRACPKPIIICQGGGDSTKTVSILQSLAINLIENKKSIATVTASDLPNLKGGAMRAFNNYVLNDYDPIKDESKPSDLARYFRSFNTSESIYYLRNGSILEFKSFEDAQDAAGSERHYLYVNEAPGVPYSLFWQLNRKTRRKTYIDYNPTSPFWVHEKLIPGNGHGIIDMQFNGKVQLFITDHRHNLFLTKDQHAMYESISDPDLFMVYSRGQTGKIKGLIFGNFKEAIAWPEESEIQRIIWGLDLGYTTDPTALTKIAICTGRKRVGKECSYAPGLSDEHIHNLLLANGWKEDQVIYSEADPNMINQLRLRGLPVIPAIKGPGSVAAGISKVREFDNYYMGENFKKEIGTYKFLTAQDIVTGKEVQVNTPVKGWDHLCDSYRYGIYTDSFRYVA